MNTNFELLLFCDGWIYSRPLYGLFINDLKIRGYIGYFIQLY